MSTLYKYLPVLLGAFALLVGVGAGHAETPRGSYVPADPDRVDIAAPRPSSHSSNILYLNGCFGSGCSVNPGMENSIANTSSIISRSIHLAPFTGSQEEWQAIMECVRKVYQPFDIVVTDTDPSPADHFEALVTGFPEDAAMAPSVAGVAPFSCGNIINNAITYTFSSLLDNDIAETCWAIAQESAHAFGLDHEYLCSDPMTYLRSCGKTKFFQDVDAPCGEFASRACACKGATQNSFQLLLAHFGPGTPTPPQVEITSPSEGEIVNKGFIVRSTAVDDISIARVELRINNTLVGTSASEPYIFNVPETVSDGRIRVQVTAIDNYSYSSTSSIEVIQGEPCRKTSQCADLEVCAAGRCVPGPELEGGLGQACTLSSECLSNQCGFSSEGNYCTETCGNGQGGCPKGFGCLGTESGSVCWPGYNDGGGCAIGTSASSLTWLLAFALLAFRRRQR